MNRRDDHVSVTGGTTMPKDEKGLNRGGIGGQEGELGEDSKNMDVKRCAGGQQDKPGQHPQRPGQLPERSGLPKV